VINRAKDKFAGDFASVITGMVTNSRYHIVCGLSYMLIAIMSFFMQNVNIYLLLAVMGIMVWLAPVLILRTYFKRLHTAGAD